MIGQQVGLRYLVPVALDMLSVNPFTDGDLYPGDLLHAVIGVPQEFWSTPTEMASRAEAIARGALDTIDAADTVESLKSELQQFLLAEPQ